MKAFALAAWFVFALLALDSRASERRTVFAEDFESADPLTQWSVSPGPGRVRVMTDPRGGANRGVLMDDPVDDAFFSQNVISKTISGAGHSGFVISLDIYSLGDESHGDYYQPNLDAFDGVVIRIGDYIRPLLLARLEQQRLVYQFDYDLERRIAAAAGIFTIELRQFDNFSAPRDGLFFDNLVISAFENRAIVVEAPLALPEPAPITLLAMLMPVPSQPVVLTLRYESATIGTAVYPAGAAYAELTFPSLNTSRLEGDRDVALYLTDGQFYSTPIWIRLIEDEPAGLGFTAPASIIEGTTARGSITVAAPRDSYVYVRLTSSDPEIISLPYNVSLYYSHPSVEFDINPTINRRILADRPVTITASIGAETLERVIIVREANSLQPTITGPPTLLEGSRATYSLTINAIADEPLPVTLSTTLAGMTISPQTLTIPAGLSQATFEVTTPNDSEFQGNRPFTLTARVANSLPGTFAAEFVDDEVQRLAIQVPDRFEANAATHVPLRAANISGTTVPTFNGAATLHLRAADNTETLLDSNIAFENGLATARLNLPYSARGSRLVLRGSGLETITPPLVIYASLPFAANDLLYDRARNRLLAASGANAPVGHFFSITPIAPDTATIGQPVSLGSEPRRIIATPNDQYLYVSLPSLKSVRRLNLATLATHADINIRINGAGAVAVDLLPIPGRPLDFIASETENETSSSRNARVYANGAPLFSVTAGPGELAPSARADEFFAYNAQNSPYDLARFRLNAAGYDVAARSSSLNLGYNARIAAENDIIFFTTGRVIDGRRMEAIANIRFPDAWANPWNNTQPETCVTTDLSRGRVYFARGNTIAAYDTSVYQLTATATLPAIGNITKIRRWGDAGLALLTSNAELILLEDPQLVPSGPTTDLAVTIDAAPQPILVGQNFTYTATIQNISEQTARAVQVTFNLTPGQSIRGISAGDLPYTTSNNTATIEAGDLAPGARLELSLAARPTESATLVAIVSASTASIDNNYANNRADAVNNAGFASTPDSVNVIKLPINDVISLPQTGRLLVTVAGAAPRPVQNRALEIDPLTGLITKSIPLPGEGTTLAISDDGSTAYALSATRTVAYRLNLTTGQFVRIVSFNPGNEDFAATDLKVLPGTIDSLIVASGGWNGARIYDNDVPRPTSTGYYGGTYLALLPEPTMAFGVTYNGFGGESNLKYQISPNGVAIQSRAAIFTGNVQHIKSDGWFVYGNDGIAARADLMTRAGAFPIAETFPTGGSAPFAVEPDRANQRVYFARDNYIAAFDSETYERLRVLQFNLADKITTLERWGADGFAARLENKELAIIRTDLIPQSNLSLTLTQTTPNLELTYPRPTNGHTYTLETTTDLQTWTPVTPTTINQTETQTTLQIPPPQNAPHHFYRLKLTAP